MDHSLPPMRSLRSESVLVRAVTKTQQLFRRKKKALQMLKMVALKKRFGGLPAEIILSCEYGENFTRLPLHMH